MRETYDAIVVGSGFGAAPPALRLAEAGHRVLLLEKGPDIVPERDFRQTQSPAYLRRYLKSIAGDHLNVTYAEGLGGGSGFYEMVSLRAPSKAFAQRDERGRRLWPAGIDRAALDPYYERAERMLDVSQIAEADIPKTGLVFAMLLRRLGLTCDRARYAVRNCQGSGYCVTGCIFGAKQSLHMNYLPAARAAGLEIRTETEVLEIEPVGGVGDSPERRSERREPVNGAPRWLVRCRDAGGRETRLAARVLVLAGGTVGSARILQRSRATMPWLSGQVGAHVAFNGSVKAAAILPDDVPDADLFTGRSHPGMICYDFLESHGITIAAVKPFPLQIVAGAHLAPPGGDPRRDYWGRDHVALMRRLRRRSIILYATGLTPPRARITTRGDGPTRVSLALDDELQRYCREVEALLQSLLVRSGCTLLPMAYLDPSGSPYETTHFFTTHHVGSCRMADRETDGVVDSHGEVFGYPGLYVSDASTLPSSLAVNTSLTVLANAERIADGIVARFDASARTAGGTPRSGGDS